MTVKYDLPKNEFEKLLSYSFCVIAALKEDVGSSGQMLVLSAMRNKKPIIYTDISAINYYFQEGCGYPYKIGDLSSLEKAYLEVKCDEQTAKKIGEKAYQRSLEFTSDSCFDKIYKIIAI